MVTVSCIIPTDLLPLSTLCDHSVSTSQVTLRVIILHTCLVRTSGQSVLEELPANAATSGSHVG